jgi:hypothetical protein
VNTTLQHRVDLRLAAEELIAQSIRVLVGVRSKLSFRASVDPGNATGEIVVHLSDDSHVYGGRITLSRCVEITHSLRKCAANSLYDNDVRNICGME